MIKGRKRLVKFYTGCPTAEIFMFIVDHVRPKHKKLQYYRGSSSTTTTPKKYQISPVTQLVNSVNENLGNLVCCL